MMDLSIIIVNWNSATYVGKCLESLYNNISNLKFEIIVVDNASYDGVFKIIKEDFPGVIFVQSDKNIGFARANNLGFRHSSGHKLLFLNPDTEVLGDAVCIMLKQLNSMEDAGAVGCKLLNSDLSIQTSCIQPFPTVLNQVLDMEYLKMFFPKMKLWGIKPLFFNNGDPAEVDAISGACMMVKRNVFEEIGLFSTDYFMYTEDIDLCFKIKQRGYKSYYIPWGNVIHHGGGSSNERESFFSVIVMRESIYRFLEKTRGKPISVLYKIMMSISSFSRLMLLIMVFPFMTFVAKKSLDHVFKKWIKIFRWSITLEKWAKELTYN